MGKTSSATSTHMYIYITRHENEMPLRVLPYQSDELETSSALVAAGAEGRLLRTYQSVTETSKQWGGDNRSRRRQRIWLINEVRNESENAH